MVTLSVPATDDIIRPHLAAQILGVSPNTLAAWRSNNRHDPPLPYVKVGSRVFYRRSDIEWWLKVRTENAPSD